MKTEHKPKFKVGDQVELGRVSGEVTEVCVHDAHWVASGAEQLYSVKTEHFVQHQKTHTEQGVPLGKPEPLVDEKGNPVGDYTIVGCVPESALKPHKGK